MGNMAIRPIDVRRKEFKSGFRGYDANQVDDFLDQVADEFERSYTENQRMREEVSSLRERLQQFEDLEGSIRSALVHAEQAANDLRNSAQREADDLRLSSQRESENLRLSSQKEAELTIQEAQTRSHQMLADSSNRVDRIQESYEVLQEAKREFTNDFRQLLKTYMDVMEDMEISTAKGIESSLRQRLDTESMAVAREAANQDQPTLAEVESDEADDGVSGPLYEDSGFQDSGVQNASNDETQRIDLSEASGEEEERSDDEAPVSEEPEAETSTTAGDEDYEERPGEAGERTESFDADSFDTDSGASDEVDREEDSIEGSDSAFERDDQASDDFFEDRRGEQKDSADDGRIFRASRFLRRRG